MKLPNKINIFSIVYNVVYEDDFVDNALWGKIDFYKREITICTKNRQESEVLEILVHEVMHGILNALNINELKVVDDNEGVVDLLSTGITDTLIRNGLVKIEV